MANCNPVIPAMDWTEDAELHKRYIRWREEVELELGSSLSGKSNTVRSNYVLRCAGKPARDYLKSLPESEFKYEGAGAEAILQALEEKTNVRIGDRVRQLTNIYCHGRIVGLVVLLVYYPSWGDGSGSLSGGAFNQLRLVTLNIVLTILY